MSWAHFRVQLLSQVAAVAMRNSGIGATERVQPAARGGTQLVVDRITCFGNAIHPAVFLGGRFLVGRQRERASLVENRSEGRIHTAASCIGNAFVSNRLSSLES